MYTVIHVTFPNGKQTDVPFDQEPVGRARKPEVPDLLLQFVAGLFGVQPNAKIHVRVEA